MLRHRVPTIFTLYMIDVLCCALGCVILLWQVNHHEAQTQTQTAEGRAKEIEALLGKLNLSKQDAAALKEHLASLQGALDTSVLSEAELKKRVEALKELLAASRKSEGKSLLTIASLTGDLKTIRAALEASKRQEGLLGLQIADLRKERDKVKQLALITKKDYDTARDALALAEKLLQSVRTDLKNLDAKQTGTAAELAVKVREQQALLKKLKGAELKIVVLEKDVADKLLVGRTTAKQVEDLTARLKASETNAQKLEQTLASLQLLSKDYLAKLKVSDIRAKLLETDVSKSKKDILEAAKRYKDLLYAQELLAKRLKLTDKDLEEAKKTVGNLRSERLALILQARMLKEASENRFAGIRLSGQRVLFLVDMSGSMSLLDENTGDPDKWPEVCDTVAKIMKSLPELKQYQVLLFSDKTRYAFGNNGRWLEYNPKVSPKAVADGLKQTKPAGDTNLHAVFEEAFKFRAQGMDTIYLLSDGLPTTGPLPANSTNWTENQKADYYAKHLRGRLKTVWNAPAKGQARVRINTIGFFFESPEVGAFLWALAREHEGGFVGLR